MTPGIRAALLAGAHLMQKDDSLSPLVKAIEDNNKAIDGRLKPLESKAQKDGLTLAAVSEQLADIEQKMAQAFRGGGPAEAQTWGAQFTEAADVKAFAAETHSRPGRVRIQMKTTITSGTGSGGALVVPQRDGVSLLPKRRLTIRNFFTPVRVTSGSVEYPRETSFTNSAAPVAEGAAKSESAWAFELVTAPIKTIAHWLPASRQILDDAPQLAGLIDTQLRYGLALKEESQLLYGDGTGQNLLGMIPQATAFAPVIDITAPTMIDTIGLAILQNALADLPADGIVMHPADWMRIRMIKDGDGNYILGAPGVMVEPALFGLPVVPTPAISIDSFLVGNFEAAATLYDRWEARVEVGTEHADFFVRNLVAVLAEERIGFAVKQAKALTYGSFGNVGAG
ncbi:phage major capsid protein [Xanthobacter sp. DSM 24535]|uniref:phage major capsid protein n=1 Tax=Roseixanthobacter psychrophilus TaxID=3119917 RepID=UPI003727ABA9